MATAGRPIVLRPRAAVRAYCRAAWLACACLTGLAALTGAQPAPPAEGRLAGRLTDGTDPLAAVTVLVSDTSASAVTDVDGRFEIGPLPAATYQLTILRGTRIAYVPDVIVRPGETTTIAEAVTWQEGFAETFVVTASSRHPERVLDAPGAVTSVGHEDVARRASHGQVPRVLEFTPGVQVTQSGLYDYNVNSRGFNASLTRRVATLIDGRDPSIPFLGSQEWAGLGIPPDDIEQVELLRGPGAALYGANASGGVLSIVTRRPRDSRGGTARVSFGGLDTINADVRWAGEVGRGWYAKATGLVRSHGDFAVSRVGAAEYSVPCPPGVTGDCLPQEAVPLRQTRTRVLSGSLRADKYLAPVRVLTMEGGLTDLEGPVILTGIGRTQFLEASRPWARVELTGLRFNLLASYMERNSGHQLSLTTGGNLALASRRTQVEGQATDTLLQGRVRYVAGASATWEHLDSADPDSGLQTVLEAPVSSRRGAVFGQVDWVVARQLKIVAAGRVDASTLHETRVSPKAALVYTPHPQHGVRVTYNEAFQVPNYSELFLQVDVAPPVNLGALNALCQPFGASCGFERTRVLALGNRTMQVETVRTWELGYKGLIAGRGFVTADWYRNRNSRFVTPLLPQLGTPLGRLNPEYGPWDAPPGVPDQVEALVRSIAPPTLSNDAAGAPILAVASYTNFGRVQTQGVDLGATWQLAPGWRWSASYSWFDFEVADLPPALANLLLPNAPPHAAATGIAYAAPRYDAAFDLRWVDGFRWAVGTFQGQVETYATADAAANYRLTSQVTIGLHAANVFDHRHWQSFGGDLLRRRILGTIRYEW